jgi:hypothetical protein
MNLINKNPFRILGLPITASEREIAKQINTLATFAEMGKTKSLDTDFPFLPSIERTPEAIEEAKKQIEQSENKLLFSLFWFWKNNSVDELALEVLKDGNTEKAIGIWEKAALASKNKIYKPVILNENLISSSTQFNDTDDEDHTLKKNVDEYIVERKKEVNNYSIPTAFYDLNFDDNWMIECDAVWNAGIDNFSYGIAFGRDKGSFYFFGINAIGSYMYAKYVDWAFTSLIDWTSILNFNKWSSNRLQIKKIGSQLNFFINGSQVNSFQVEPFFGKGFGFKVTNKQKVTFRNFRFSKLVEDETYGEGLNVSQKNFSNIKNLSTLYLGLAVASTKGTFKLSHFRKGIVLAKNIFANGNMDEYSKLIAGDRYDYNSEKTLHFYINNILDSVKPFLDKSDGISTNELVNSFATFPVEAKQFLNNKFFAKQIQSIDKEIAAAQSARKASAANATDAGKILQKNTKADLDYLRKTLGDDNFQYQTIADKLALAIVQCGIDAFNFCKTPNGEIDYPNAIRSEEGYVHEYEYAFSIAFTQRARDRAKENLDSCKQYIESKIYYNCWFCGDNSPEDASKFEITLYKETSRDYQGVKYQYLPVKIPRCSACKSYHRLDFHHEPVSGKTFGFGLVGLLAGVAVDVVAFVGGNTISGISKTVSKIADKSNTQRKDTSHSTLSSFPRVKEMLREGWQFEQPKA